MGQGADNAQALLCAAGLQPALPRPGSLHHEALDGLAGPLLCRTLQHSVTRGFPRAQSWQPRPWHILDSAPPPPRSLQHPVCTPEGSTAAFPKRQVHEHRGQKGLRFSDRGNQDRKRIKTRKRGKGRHPQESPPSLSTSNTGQSHCKTHAATRIRLREGPAGAPR